MPDEPDREPQDADAGFGRLIDRLLPPELRVDADVQLRSRVLVMDEVAGMPVSDQAAVGACGVPRSSAIPVAGTDMALTPSGAWN